MPKQVNADNAVKRIREELVAGGTLSLGTLADTLALDDFTEVYRLADQVNEEVNHGVVRIRAILEFSNVCRRQCRYCGLNCENKKLERYQMGEDEMVQTTLAAYRAGYQTIVLQSGEDPYYDKEMIGRVIREIKARCGISITLSLGERTKEEYAYWKECGADRYLLKHETSDPEIYAALHPCGTLENRIQCLRWIKELGYETGSGFMIGLPGQTCDTIAGDILLLRELSCDMAGIGPFIAHPDTALKDQPNGSTELTKRAVALSRILMPHLHLPATTALGVLSQGEKSDVFSCGADVVMRKVTPGAYRRLYEIYPSGLGLDDDIVKGRMELEDAIRQLGKQPL
ncbi:[FeFe] hydrogenase H-cluster radical SAM maturase HydE [Zongyangia hominis]|uniref:[FeFe] hydrogenase H-cluster radical SAM maturase HydE n=1 Tax=Zongyangia hominis TaxID=2763677 RepID=A0A926ECG6_9FIRM|nr:[FeFe] hydrogenase H-cluster radical SAM maturase HydE [Zongyangia hominis]MBC8569694.1 [FeFe] hydrogenase H-cluster radical SAM maturase HydE [Zongyangia hominis]